MKIEFLCVLLCIGALFCVCSGNPNQEKSARSLIYIGSYNGHQFYQADDTQTTDYDTAKRRCSTQGMRLARFVSDAEIEYLRPILPVKGQLYWTAGKSKPASFNWDDGSNVIPTVLSMQPSCLYFFSIGDYLWNLNCTMEAYVLCDNAL